MKEALVFVGYLEEVFSACRNYPDYEIILIAEKYPVIRDQIHLDRVFIVNDYTNKETMSDVMERIMSRFHVKALYANIEWAVCVCGYLRDRFQITGMDEMVCELTRDKYKMKQQLRKVGIPTAKVQLINGKDDILQLAKETAYPIIVKPRSGSATVNTFMVKNEAGLNRVYDDIAFNVNQYIAESFVKGEEYHCDSVVVDGKVCFSSVGKYYTNCVNTVETDLPVAAVIYPDTDTSEIIQHIKELNEKVIKALGIKTSICHLEVFENDGDLVVGEIASRIGGGPLIGNAIFSSMGVNIYELFIDISLKKDIRIQANKHLFGGYVAFPYKNGRIRKISSTEEYKNKDYIDRIRVNYTKGDEINSKKNTACRTGYAIIHGEDPDDTQKKLLAIYNSFVLEMEQEVSGFLDIF